MECTQKLECTQDLYDSHCERTCSDQIGFLGICGTKYPVKRGPNKIGRDPETCNIILNLNSVSRQHAVINILSSREFMLMDLDSANKTKLVGKTLQPYIPHPLRNGDMVQFGQVFGVFRLFEDETDLPMTQALDIPETPVFSKHMSRINNAPVTTIPESPDVSDKDDSFIVASQTKSEKNLKTSNNNFIKPSGQLIAIQPVGSKRIDNIYWTSSKKSTSISLRLDDSNNSHNESTITLKNDTSNQKKIDIHELDTQDPFSKKENMESIHTIETQTPFKDNKVSIHELATQAPTLDGFEIVNENSIYNIETQVPNVEVLAKQKNQSVPSPTIYSLETQLPVPEKDVSLKLDDNSPIEFNDSQLINNLETQDLGSFDHQVSKVRTIDDLQEQELRLDILSSKRKDEDDSIFEAETQVVSMREEQVSQNNLTNVNNVFSGNKHNNFNAFDEINTQSFHHDDFDSELLNTVETKTKSIMNENESETDEDTQKIKPLRRSVHIDSDESTDCDDIDILPTQKISCKGPDDDLTDCEDDIFESEIINVKKINESKGKTDNKIYLHDQPTQILQEKNDDEDDLQDMLTQVIDEDFARMPEKESNFENILTQKLEGSEDQKALEYLPTQIIEEKSDKIDENKDKLTPVNSFDSPFKVPLASPLRVKKSLKINIQKQDVILKQESNVNLKDDDEKYYNATQDIFDDLCSQKTLSPEIGKEDPIRIEQRRIDGKFDEDIVPSSVENYKIGERFPHLDKELSPKEKCDSSSDQSDGEEKVKKTVNKQQLNNVIGSETQVAIIQKLPSDPSDVEVTPKKLKPFRLLETELPSSQEIKTGVSYTCRSLVAESSSESEVEQNDSEECTPILFKKKTKTVKPNAKMDLTKKFDLEALPSRVSTRARKPTAKLQNGEGDALKVSKSILKSTYINELEENIDNEIIVENITRLRNKSKNAKKDKPLVLKHVSDKSKDIKQVRNDQQKQQNVVDSNTLIITEPKRPRGRPRILKKSTEDAIVSEIIKVINQRDSNKTYESQDSYNSLILESKDSKSINLNSGGKRSSGRTKNKSQKQGLVQVEVIDKTRRSHPKQEEKPNKSKKDTKKENTKKDEGSGVVKDNSIKQDRRKRTNKKEAGLEICDLSSPEKESDIRRSKRRRNKENSQNQDKQNQPKEQEKSRKFEQSTVYNISSESGNDSPRNLKRSFAGEVLVPSAKRSRSNVSSNSSLRSSPARAVRTHYVLFTAFPCEEVRFKLEKLGAVIVTDVTKCTVLLTLQIKRTFKLLCAVGLGVPIVGPNWVQACADTNMIVDPWLYLIKDVAAEKRFAFNLERTLTGKRSFLSGFNVSSTASVMPASAEMKLIVESSGGVWKDEGPNWICVSCTADKSQWPSLKRKGAIVVSTEFILGGVLRQKLDIEKNKFK